VKPGESKLSASGWASAIAVLGFVCAAGTAAGAGGMYKWVDDQGVVHYTDRIPPESVSKGATVLDKQGRSVKTIDPAPTAEQRKAIEAEAERQRDVAKANAEQARRDRALTQSFSSEAEIDVARARAISTMEGQLTTIGAYIADMSRRKQDLEQRKAGYGSKPVPAQVDTELNSVTEELARQNALQAQKKEALAAIGKKYGADKKRWQEIKAEQEEAAERQRAVDAQKASAPPAPVRGRSAAASTSGTKP
jgi:DNA repair exonuclease SbcCD ATPase subunit